MAKPILIHMSEAEAEALNVLAGIDCRERKPYIELHLRKLIKASREILPNKIVKSLDKEKAGVGGN